MPVGGLVVDDLLYVGVRLAHLAHRALDGREHVAGRYGDERFLAVEVDNLVEEANRLVSVTRLHAGVALHEDGIGDELLIRLAALGLNLDLAPLARRGAVTGHEVRRLRAGAFGVDCLLEELHGAVDAGAVGEVKLLVDGARHVPVPLAGRFRDRDLCRDCE